MYLAGAGTQAVEGVGGRPFPAAGIRQAEDAAQAVRQQGILAWGTGQDVVGGIDDEDAVELEQTAFQHAQHLHTTQRIGLEGDALLLQQLASQTVQKAGVHLLAGQGIVLQFRHAVAYEPVQGLGIQGEAFPDGLSVAGQEVAQAQQGAGQIGQRGNGAEILQQQVQQFFQQRALGTGGREGTVRGVLSGGSIHAFFAFGQGGQQILMGHQAPAAADAALQTAEQGPQGLPRAGLFPGRGGLEHAQIGVAQAGQQIAPVEKPVLVPSFMQAEQAVQQVEEGRTIQRIAHGDVDFLVRQMVQHGQQKVAVGQEDGRGSLRRGIQILLQGLELGVEVITREIVPFLRVFHRRGRVRLPGPGRGLPALQPLDVFLTGPVHRRPLFLAMPGQGRIRVQADTGTGLPETAEQDVLGLGEQGKTGQQHGMPVSRAQQIGDVLRMAGGQPEVMARRGPALLGQRRHIGIADAPQGPQQGRGRGAHLVDEGQVVRDHVLAQQFFQQIGQTYAPGQEGVRGQFAEAFFQLVVFIGQIEDAVPQQGHPVQQAGRTQRHGAGMHAPQAHHVRQGKDLGQQAGGPGSGIDVHKIAPRTVVGDDDDGITRPSVAPEVGGLFQGRQEGLLPGKDMEGAAHASSSQK